MSSPFIIFLVFVAATSDSIICLFKKIEQGNWATKFSKLSSNARTGAIACLLCCVPLSAFFTFVLFRFLGKQNGLLSAIFFSAAYTLYRLLMFISDKGASKRSSRYPPRIEKERRVRLCYSLICAILSVAVAAAAISILRERIFALS